MTMRRMSAYDRVFLGYEITKVVGPVTGVTVGSLREALLRLHRADPDHPAVSGIDVAGGRWIRYTPAQFAARVSDLAVDLSEVPPPAATLGGPVDIDSLARYAGQALRLGDRTLVFAVHGPYVVAKFSHTLGSGAYLNRVIAGIELAAATGSDPVLPEVRQDRLLIARAALRHFGRHPGRLVSMFRQPRPVPATPAATRTVTGWRSTLTVRSARSVPGVVREVRAWRDRYAPDASFASIVFAGLWSAVAAAGLDPDPGGMVLLVDGQRYLPKGVAAGPNFIIGQYLAPGAPDDPRAVHRTLHGAINSGRPIAAMADRLLRQPRDIGDDDLTPVPDPARPTLILTNGRLDMFEALPWVGADHARHVSLSSVGEPTALNIAAWEMGGALHLAASFHAAIFAPDAVASALRLFCTTPTALLTGSPSVPATS